MKDMDATYKAMRMFSKMMQEDHEVPKEIRVDFAMIDKMQDIRDLLGKVTKNALTGGAQPETKQELLEYLTLVESGIVIFAEEQGLLEKGERHEP